jgi:hypothetical protein
MAFVWLSSGGSLKAATQYLVIARQPHPMLSIIIWQARFTVTGKWVLSILLCQTESNLHLLKLRAPAPLQTTLTGQPKLVINDVRVYGGNNFRRALPWLPERRTKT